MRYIRKFRGDDITEDDFMPIRLNSLDLEIPEIKESSSGKGKLDQLPIRVKTRFRGGRNAPGRRVVSTPIFDLVAPGVDLLPPPVIRDTSSISNAPKMSLRGPRKLPPLPERKELPLLPEIHKDSMPLEVEKALHEPNNSFESFTSIIEIYKQHAPFGSVHQSSFIGSTSSAVSIPEIDASSSSSGSEFSFNGSEDLIKEVSESPQSSISSAESYHSHQSLSVAPPPLRIPNKVSPVMRQKHISMRPLQSQASNDMTHTTGQRYTSYASIAPPSQPRPMCDVSDSVETHRPVKHGRVVSHPDRLFAN